MSVFDLIFPVGPLEQVGRDKVDGLIVSTVLTSDMGYETAIIDTVGCYPVERYLYQIDAEEGHAKWKGKVVGLTRVVRIGYEDLVKDEMVELVRPPVEDVNQGGDYEN